MKQGKEKIERQASGRRLQLDRSRRLAAGRAGRAPSARESGLEALVAPGEAVALEKGAFLVKEGQSGEEDFLVVSGALMLFKSLPPDRRLVIGFRFPGELVTLRRCDAPWPITVRALMRSKVRRLDCGGLCSGPVVGAGPTRALLDHASDEIAALEEHIMTLGCKRTEERVATFLLELVSAIPCQSQGADGIFLPMTRSVIADYLGLAPETVSRTFSRLAEDGLIDLPRPSQVVVLDWPALKALAAGRGPGLPKPPG
ncbi:MAG: Crp/Fnr family transcriptional regulator [Rhodospirillales bacterium]|nr:Crp/Fnr family transcriptional regulator [Rhodospirillales bacterium]